MKGNSTAHGSLHRVEVYKFAIGDVDDPMVYAGEPLYKWEQSDAGKWVKEHAIDLEWRSQLNHMCYGTEFVVVATLNENDYTWFVMKYA